MTETAELRPLPGADFERRARAALSFALPPVLASGAGAPGPAAGLTGDHSLDGQPFAMGVPKPAAVLVAVVAHARAATVLLTQRTGAMRQHAGQIAFPGGKIDPADPTPLAAALREAEEEIGLSRDALEPLGYLDPYLTGTGYLVLPVVALVEPPLRLAPNPEEVADVFEVPLMFLMDPANHQRARKTVKDRVREFYAMPFEDRYIWGATAGILRNLYERLYAAC